MRNIINISLPSELAKKVECAVASGRYATKSEFFRDLLRLWDEEQVLQELREAQRDIARGKGRILHSLKSLRGRA
ncbi:MAG: ribbon-helix-helix domain-containing protein [bacterium]|nr:ribbon-helix-helix domain-containing protein [bacterium]